MEGEKKDKTCLEAKQKTGICRGYFKMTSGEVDYLIDGRWIQQNFKYL
jgi:hypothetical protein